jgi:hypothetical protein
MKSNRSSSDTRGRIIAGLRHWCLAVLTAGAVLPRIAHAAAFHSVFYHRLQGSFWAELADDTGPRPAPRELAIASINNNFRSIRSLGFDTVTIGLPDSDSWVSQHGGGFSYDPKNPAAGAPQFAVAQEIVLRIADADHLKVIFAIGFSNYRRSSDGRPAWAGLADEYGSTSTPKGAYDFLHALIDPTGFYGEGLTTTRLAGIGLPDGPVRSHVGDARVVGWNFAGEWSPGIVNRESHIHTHEHVFKKYWNFFYDLVHYHGANTAFAATYLIGEPSGGAAQVANIKAFKQWFAPGSGIRQPDLVGVEFYCNGTADPAGIGTELNEMVDAMEKADPRQYPHDFAIAPAHVFLAEGGTNEATSPATGTYFQDVFHVLAARGLPGIQLWVSDTLADSRDASGKLTLGVAAPAYDLFTTRFSPAGERLYPPLADSVSWHGGIVKGGSYADPASFTSSREVRAAAYGSWTYTGLTEKGRQVQQALSAP